MAPLPLTQPISDRLALPGLKCLRCCQLNAVKTGASFAAAADAAQAAYEPIWGLNGLFGALGPYGSLPFSQAIQTFSPLELEGEAPLGKWTEQFLLGLVRSESRIVSEMGTLLQEGLGSARSVRWKFAPPGAGGSGGVFLPGLWGIAMALLPYVGDPVPKLPPIELPVGNVDLPFAPLADLVYNPALQMQILNVPRVGSTGVFWQIKEQIQTETLQETLKNQGVRIARQAQDCDACVRQFLWGQDKPRARLVGKFRARF